MKTPIGLTAKLPVMDLFKEAMELLWVKRNAVIKMFLPIIALMSLLDWATENLIQLDDHSTKFVMTAISALFSVLFATAGHQFTLLPEQTRSYKQAIRLWGVNEFRYLLRAIQIAVIASLFFLLIMFAVMFLGEHPQLPILGSSLGALVAVYIWGRLSIVLPEAALGKPTSIKRAWGLSQGNGIGLCLVVIIIPVLIMSPFFALFLFETLVVKYFAAIGIYITTLISLVALSLTYRFLSGFYDANEFQA